VRGLLAAALLLALATAEGARIASSQEPDAEAVARAYLARSRLVPIPENVSGLAPAQQRSAAAAAPAQRDLEHVATLESRGARHVRFQETEDGIPIFGAQVVVNISKDTDEVGLVSDERQPATVASSVRSIEEDEALNIALDAADIEELRDTPESEAVYYPIDGELYLAWQVILPAIEPLGDWLVIVLAEDGDVAQVSNIASLDSGRVFDPNPVATGGPQGVQHCDTTAAESIVDDEYVTRTLLGINSGEDQLRGEYVDLTAPGIVGGYKSAGQASSASNNYVYDCNDDRFEEVMVYYHIDATQRAFQALGFTGVSAILDEPIPAHAHYYVDCNAFYSTVDAGLHFGDCGSPGHDTAEDADVIIHEYGHAMHDDQVPGWGIGTALEVEEARGIGEGFSDFLAAVMTGSPCIGDWANFGQLSCGGSTGLRTVDNNLNYSSFESCPDNPDGSEEEHCTGEIWAGALWALAEALGGDDDARDLALTLVVDSHFYLSPQATFDDGVCAIFAADDDLFDGSHGSVIANVFSNRGINCTFVPPPDFPYAFLRVRHTGVGDLVMRIKAGANPNSPVCNLLIWNRSGGTSDDVVGFVDLSDAGIPAQCKSALPPSAATPWWLEVQDMASGNTGTIEDFEVVLSGTVRCIANDTPLAIPDGSPGAIVRSMTDCSTSSEPLPTPSHVWYFAEGFTGDGYLTFISLMNPGGSSANVTATFNLDGAAPQVENVAVPANSRRTIAAHDAAQGPGPGWAFGLKIESDQPIVAQEVLVKPSESLAHATIGSKTLSPEWYFAEGFTGDGYLTFISLMNPGSSATNVTATFNLDGAAPVVRNVAVPANSRRTIPAHDPTDGPGPGFAFGVEISAEHPIMAQEVLVKPTESLAHGTIGSQSLSNTWYFAEGFTGDDYLTFISIMNPGSSSASVTATFNLDGAAPVIRNLVVPANSRRTIPAHDSTDGAGPGLAFGIELASSQPVVAQEVLVKPTESLAHATIGSQNLSASWYFAEGFTGDGYLTFISLMNPGSSAASVTVTFNLDGAAPVVENIVIPAESRRTVAAHDAAQGPGPGWAFGVVVSSDQPIVAQEVLVKPTESLAHGTAGTQLTAGP